MAGLLIGIIWFFIVVGGILALSALVQMIRSPFRDR
jgi:hypothetical protein